MAYAATLLEEVKASKMDIIFLDLYGEEKLIGYQKARYQKVLKWFIETFGNKKVEIYSAPGRTEIGGNHTDHQHGHVVAAAINRDIIAITAATQDGTIKIFSDGSEICNCKLQEIQEKRVEKGTSKALVKGVLSELHKSGLQIGGFCAYLTSDVLVGSGLSSSAAFENVIGYVAVGLFGNAAEVESNILPVEIAKISQHAENYYFGKPCGLMDQMASSVGNLIHIDFKDPNQPQIEQIQVDFSQSGYVLCMIDTKGSHEDLTLDYAAIPMEMKAVAKLFSKEVLREVDENEFYRNIAMVREHTGDRAVLRAMHFFEENRRAQMEAKALQTGDFQEFLNLVRESGNSSFKFLQNIYSNQDVETQNVALAIALSEKYLGRDRGVVRVHGGGFAGTIQCFIKKNVIEDFCIFMNQVFQENCCSILYIRKKGGTRVM